MSLLVYLWLEFGMDDGEKVEIPMTDVERRLFELLLAVVGHFALGTTLRVAGGWVRDKLMGRDSHDIDVALDNLSGQSFAEKMNEYLASVGLETHHIGVIQSNPDQSKHLETATVKVLGFWVDFVNLRSETYTEHSRIPTKIEIGTPEEDANRRDLTINALFYNINTGLVEDFTGHGIEHLRAKVICTPLPPLQTFMDDPLRVLRAFRFGCRLPGFSVDAELLSAASSPEVIDALAKKIARERIGKELDGMLRATRPELAIGWISSLKLFPVVFALPPQLNQPIDCATLCVEASTLVRRLMCISRSMSLEWDHEERRVAILAAALLPFAELTYNTPKRKVDTVTNYIVLESLKHPKVDADQVGILHFGVKQFERLFRPAQVPAPGEPGIQNVPLQDQKVTLGRVMRRVGHLWHTCLALATLDHLPAFTSELTVDQFDPMLPEDSSIRSTYSNIKAEILALGMERAHEMKPYFSGDDLQQLLQLSPGPVVGIIIDAEIDWMLEHYEDVLAKPEATKEKCKEHLLSPIIRTLIEQANANKKKGKK